MLRGLIFDNGDVLFDASQWRRWLVQYLAEYGIHLTYEALVSAWEERLIDVYRGREDYWSAFRQMLSSLGMSPPDVESCEAAAHSRGQQFAAGRKPMSGVSATLSNLTGAGIRLAVLSDSESGRSGVTAILQQLGIAHHFDAVLSSCDLGFTKPNPAAYHAAVTALGLGAGACGFVGHDREELEGAQLAGLIAIAFNYERGAPADIYVERFEQLVNVVEDQR